MIKSIKILVVLVFLSLIVCNCSSERLDVDVSDIQVNLTVERLEQELFASQIGDVNILNKDLHTKYGFLYEAFLLKMINIGSPHDPMAVDQLKLFLVDTSILSIYKEIEDKFKDFSPYTDKLNESFKYYKYYFQDSSMPRVVTFYSHFNANVFPYEDQLGIGLDMYLGTEHNLVKGLPNEFFPQYIKEKMDDDFLVADAMKGWLMNKFAKDMGDDFLSKIVALGKVMYLLDATMPFEDDHIKFGSSETKLNWCFTHEKDIWMDIVNSQVLYSKDKSKIMPYVSEGPFTKGMPHESPSQVGIWLGWQIVRDYMKYNEEVTVLDLLQIKDARVILKSYSQGERNE